MLLEVFSLLQAVVVHGLEAMESLLLLEMKEMNGAVQKQLRPRVGEGYVEAAGLMYSTEYGIAGGNTGEVMILVSAGAMYPADMIATQRIRKPLLGKKAVKKFGTLPSIVPGLHTEAAADLMATGSAYMRGCSRSVVQVLLDVPSMQRSKHYYFTKIETFFQKCQEPMGRSKPTKND